MGLVQCWLIKVEIKFKDNRSKEPESSIAALPSSIACVQQPNGDCVQKSLKRLRTTNHAPCWEPVVPGITNRTEKHTNSNLLSPLYSGDSSPCFLVSPGSTRWLIACSTNMEGVHLELRIKNMHHFYSSRFVILNYYRHSRIKLE